MSRANATVRDVALAAKGSTATVSRVFNQVAESQEDTALDNDNSVKAHCIGQTMGGHADSSKTAGRAARPSDSSKTTGRAAAHVSQQTRERVLAAAELLDYHPNHVARSLNTRSTRTIAILAPELANDFFTELAESAEKELGKAGYMLLISSSSNSAEEEGRRLRVLSQRPVDGIIVVPASREGLHIQAIADAGTPVECVIADSTIGGVAEAAPARTSSADRTWPSP